MTDPNPFRSLDFWIAVEVDYAAFGPEHSCAAPVAYPDFKPVKN